MMLSNKNSEALENFSEKLEVEGRSLWQDARRRFMHNRAAVASLVVLIFIALFVTLAPRVVAVHLLRYRLGHDVQCA
ncbi:binding-protein-dependent transport system inner membrane protein [Lelliottia amnigena]|nr:binding-protein-dependent transport system inner membrane protein [Lelliottia amnigena]